MSALSSALERNYGACDRLPAMARIVLYCQPGAKNTRLAGLYDGKPKIQLRAPPVEGEANRTLIDFLAERCALPKSQITIESGLSSRIKRVNVEGITDAALRQLLMP